MSSFTVVCSLKKSSRFMIMIFIYFFIIFSTFSHSYSFFNSTVSQLDAFQRRVFFNFKCSSEKRGKRSFKFPFFFVEFISPFSFFLLFPLLRIREYFLRSLRWNPEQRIEIRLWINIFMFSLSTFQLKSHFPFGQLTPLLFDSFYWNGRKGIRFKVDRAGSPIEHWEKVSSNHSHGDLLNN